MGVLSAGDLKLQTLELPWRGNHPLTSCIPEGTYQVKLLPSTRFGRIMPRLLSVPGRTGILIHAGNGPSNTEGCILVGMDRGADGKTLLHSRSALLLLFTALTEETFNKPNAYLRVSYASGETPNGEPLPRQFSTP